MRSLSFDIGTSKICGMVFDSESGNIPETLHSDNPFIKGGRAWEHIQDGEAVFQIVRDMQKTLTKKYAPISCIGISAQMHGIMYVDSKGRAVSPLYTWQDGSGALPFRDGKTFTQYLNGLASKNKPPLYTLAPGYGLVTHFCHLSTGTVPEGASKLCTMGDYAAMRLCGEIRPLIHATNACSLGFFDPRTLRFDYETLEDAGIDPSILPRMVKDFEALGETAGVPAAAAIGDNQAAFLGSMRRSERGALINIGTGGQISFTGEISGSAPALEQRPYFEGKPFHSGASLCGGKAYAVLEEFFRAVLRMAGLPADTPLYAAMDAALSQAAETGPLCVSTLFEGSRRDPLLRGWIKNISRNNFTPEALIRGFLEGMAGELYDMLPPGYTFEFLAGSGNGIRRNPHLRRIIEKKFGLPLMTPLYEEEAAFGAALYALISAGYFKGTAEASSLIKYRGGNGAAEASP
jgi:sedoheptulokinase